MLPLIILQCFLAFQLAPQLVESFQSQFWEKVPVNLHKLEVKTHETRKWDMLYRTTEKTMVFSIDTVYEYTHANRKYRGTRFAIAQSSDHFYVSQGFFDEVKSRYPAFGYLDPLHRGACVLVKGIDPGLNIWLPLWMTGLLASLGILFRSIKDPRLRVPLFCCLAISVVNYWFLPRLIGPNTSFYITLLIIALGFLAGQYKRKGGEKTKWCI